MKKIRLLLLSFCVVSTTILHGQESDFGAIIPPSPEAASLAKYTEIPVSYYTGLPQISIPLYSFDVDGQNVEIGLSYHARGIPVGEIASRVGIGWTLNAGGAVTRQTRGKPDDLPEGYLQDDFYSTFFTNASTRQSVYVDIVGDNIDIEPDRFSFNFLGFSGKFYFKQMSDEIVMEQYSDLRIEPIFQSGYYMILGWIITTPDGYKYYFGLPANASQTTRIARDRDEIQNHRATLGSHSLLNSDYSPAYNSWQLVDIISPTGKAARFDYDEETSIFYRKTYDTTEDNGSGVQELVSYDSKVTSSQSQLKTISFDGGTVNFINKTQSRSDLNSAHALEYIEIKDNFGVPVKKYRLSTSYSYNSSTGNVLPFLAASDASAAYRLFLDSVTELDGSTELPPYLFTYTNKSQLPNRFSTSQDFWGYYNGKDNGYFLNSVNAGEQADDKTVDPDKAKVGLLSRITYPTGGYADYDFEANQALPPPYFSLLGFNDINPIALRSASLFKNYVQWVSAGVYESDEFTVGDPVSNYVTTNFSIYGSSVFYAQIVNSSGSVIQNIPVGINNIILSNFISGGKYKIRVRTSDYDDPYDPTNSFNVSLRWDEFTASQSDLIYGGGNRIKRIVLNDANGKTTEKEYLYIAQNGKSSGRIYSLPCYNFINTVTGDGVMHFGILRPGSPLTYNQGNHIGYSSVTEYLGDSEENSGKTQYFYTNMYDDGTFWEWPYTIPDDNEDFRGKLVRIDYYNYNSDVHLYNKVKETNYSYTALGNKVYTYDNLDEIPSTATADQVDRLKFCIPLAIFCCSADPNSYTTYYIRGGTMQLSGMENIEYDGNLFQNPNNEPIVSEEEYTYDNVNNYQMIRSEKTGSDGNIITTKYYHPSDYGNYFSTLKDKNIIVPIDRRTYCGNKLISGKQINYNNNGQPADLYVAEIASGVTDIAFSGSNPFTFTHKAQYFYNSLNKLQQISPDNSYNTAYLWDETGTYLMAKVEGATHSQINSLEGKDCTYDSDVLYNSIKGVVPSDALITTYSYRPLVGMTSQTDANGTTTYYEYDDFGRLKNIRNDDQAIVSRNYYHYYSQTDSDGPVLNVSKTSMSFSTSGGSSTFEVDANCSWTVSDNASWLSVSPTSGNEDGTVTVTVTANTSSARTATVTITGAGNLIRTITVSQAGYVSPSLSVIPTSLLFSFDGGTATCTVTSNISWSASTSADWITISGGAGSGNGSFVVTCSSNPDGQPAIRLSTIIVSGGGITKSVRVSQSGIVPTE